jgi:hypothetical protein
MTGTGKCRPCKNIIGADLSGQNADR